jgi:Na+-translocating ferredoxin:NAD+ oxidoreductase RnfD subunit
MNNLLTISGSPHIHTTDSVRKIMYSVIFAMIPAMLVSVYFFVLDEQNQRIVTVDGFVYYPNKDKKNLTRQLESLIYTLSFINPDQEKQ